MPADPIPRGVPHRMQWYDTAGRLHTIARCYLLTADGGTRWLELVDTETGAVLNVHYELHAPQFREVS